ncbi:hypothetical protein [Actinophytocola gossypii]|uniref:MFS transporter n=1 Tax=Actinophytocola gossypii TaxID=2812003 RepID=A0ABT2JJQ3_9PSEU|nr:hypothetical protein [Actinophytocola gossypii]MCT2588122.1 hypothetical protein [Actinophytocola gossypii]
MSYRALARSVPVPFLPLGLLARLPYAMTPLGTLLVLEPAGGHTFAGLAAGAQSVAIAVSGLAAGALAARFGARRLGMVLAVLNALAVLGLVLASDRPAMFAAAVLVGLTQPHVGLLVRVHWAAALGGSPLLRTGFAYEGAVDELSFVLGPAVVGLLAVGGSWPLLGMAVLLVGAALPLSTMYSHVGGGVRGGGRVPWAPMTVLTVGMAAVGAVFGSVQVAVTASAGNAGGRYALLGLGSVVAGVAYAWLPARFGVRARYVTFSATLVAGMMVLAFGARDWPAPAILAAGVVIAPYMITLYTLTETVTPRAGLPLAMGVLGAGGPVGTAVGQAVTGRLVDTAGLTAAWFAPLGCAAVGLVVALLGRSRVTPPSRRRPWRRGTGPAGCRPPS